MSTTYTTTVTLRLRWGPNPNRDVEVPYQLRRNPSDSDHRYYVEVGGQKVGWVIRNDRYSGGPAGTWCAYVKDDQVGRSGWYTGQAVDDGCRTRRDAAEAVVWALTSYARSNALADLAEQAYAD